MYIYIYTHTYTHAYIHTCIHAYMRTCIHASIRLYVYDIYIYVYISLYSYINTYAFVYFIQHDMCVYLPVRVFVCKRVCACAFDCGGFAVLSRASNDRLLLSSRLPQLYLRVQ